ncbi:MAG: hypothetical protein ACXAB2_08485 [Candidatus Hodarchaeales archaeon]
MSFYDYYTQHQQKADFLQFLLILIDKTKQNFTSYQLDAKSRPYWKGAYSTAHWIKEQWTTKESLFTKNLIAKRDSLLIHIDYNLKTRHPQGIIHLIYPELFELMANRAAMGVKEKEINMELKKAFARIRQGWEADP